jgi:hypothetical protein
MHAVIEEEDSSGATLEDGKAQFEELGRLEAWGESWKRCLASGSGPTKGRRIFVGSSR